MWPNPQETAVLSHLLKKTLMENLFCALVVPVFADTMYHYFQVHAS